MVAESKKVTSYREERVRSSSVGPREGYGNTLERMNSMNNKSQGKSPDWNRHLDELLDELQTSINHPSATERSDGISPVALYGQLTSPTTNGLLMPNGFAGLTDKDKVTSHVKEEYVSPDKKTRTFKESYEFSGQSGGPDAAVTRHGTVSYYTSKFQDANLDGRGRIKRTGSLRDRSPDRFLEASSLLRELRMRDGGVDSLGRQRSRSPESYVQRETPYSTIRSTTGYKSHRTFSESGGDAVTSVPDSIRQKYSPSDPSFTPKTPKRSASLDRRPSFERYGTAVKDSGATSTWRSAREGSWPKYTDTASSRNSNNSTYKSRNQYSYNYMEGDTPERRVRKDRSPSPPAHSRSGSRRRDASPIRPGYGDEQRPNGDFYSANNTYASIDRESRGRTRYREEHRHHVSRDRDGSPGSESRSPSAGHRPYKQRDASPIMPGYGTDADPSKIVRSYNYQYMYDGSGSRSPSPNSVRRYFSQKSIEEQKQREPTKHKIQFVRKEPERPPTPVGERVFPKNITSPNAGDQRPPKEVEDLLASLSGQKLHEYRKVDTTSLQQIRSSTPKPEKKVEIDETRIVIRQQSDDEQKKLVPSTAGPAVYYPPGFDQTLQKKEDGKTVPLWMRAEGEMSRGSYKYQSRSKSKEKKGAVAVPVCLPVCCAAPLCCSVM